MPGIELPSTPQTRPPMAANTSGRQEISDLVHGGSDALRTRGLEQHAFGLAHAEDDVEDT